MYYLQITVCVPYIMSLSVCF